MIKNKYKDDYERVTAGQYHYIGKYFTLPMDEKEKRIAGIWNIAVTIGFFLLEILAGLLNANSSRTAWIVFPYLFLFLPTAYMAIGAYAFMAAPLKMKHSEYENSLGRLKRSCIAILALSAVHIVLDLIFILLHISEIEILKEVFYLLCFALMVILGIIYGKNYDRLYGGIVVDN